MTWNLPGDIVDATDRTAEHFNKFRDCFNVLAFHGHSGADGDGAMLSGFTGMMDGQTAIVFYPNANGTNVTGGLLGGIKLLSAGSGLQYTENFIYLRAGTYDLTVYYQTTVNSEIYLNNSLVLGLPIGANNATVSGLVISSSGNQTVKLRQFFYVSGDYVTLNVVSFARTGDAPSTAPPAPQWRTKIFTAGEVLTATDLNQIRDNFQLLSQHKHTGVVGDGAAVVNGGSEVESVLPQVQILARFPKSTTGFTYSTSTNYRLGFVAQSSAQNDEIVFPVGLQAGTYRLEFLYGKGSNCGIATFYLDATSVGTIDTYNAATSYNDASAVTGITVATSGWYDFKIKMATKNGSSSGYVCRWQAVNLVRTGA